MNSVPLLVLGLGNVLLADDGVGAAAVAQLGERFEPPASVLLLDGGTLGLSLLPYVEAAERLILLDAIQVDCPPGTLVRLEGDEVGPAVATRLSPHQVGVADLLDGVRLLGRYPKTVVLLGLVPFSLDLWVGLSAPVAAQLPTLVHRAVLEAAEMGFPFRVRTANDTGALRRPAPDVVRLAGLCR